VISERSNAITERANALSERARAHTYVSAAFRKRFAQRLRGEAHLGHVLFVLGVGGVEIGSAEGESSRSSTSTKRRQARQRRRGTGMRPLSALAAIRRATRPGAASTTISNSP
jgi:hypothetical protein